METTTVRIAKEKRDILKIIASIERRGLQDIFAELIDDYIQRNKETLEILSNPQWVELITKGKQEIKERKKGKSLHELED